MEKTWGILIYYQSNIEKLSINVLDRILDIHLPHALFPVMLGDYDDCVFTVVGVVFMYKRQREPESMELFCLFVTHTIAKRIFCLTLYSLQMRLRQYVL